MPLKRTIDLDVPSFQPRVFAGTWSRFEMWRMMAAIYLGGWLQLDAPA